MAFQSVWDKAMSGMSIFLALLERRVRRAGQNFWHVGHVGYPKIFGTESTYGAYSKQSF